MIGAARQAGSLGALPVADEFRVDAVAALGRLDIGEFDAALMHRVPVDIALIFGHVDAVNGEIPGELGRLGLLVLAGLGADQRPLRESRGSLAAGGEREQHARKRETRQ